jgi:tetrahydromethanopterin S-methyltransferase subunit B
MYLHEHDVFQVPWCVSLASWCREGGVYSLAGCMASYFGGPVLGGSLYGILP